MIRFLTSLVALFTVTSIHTQAALNQFSELLSEVVDAQKGSISSNLPRRTLANEVFQQLIQRKFCSKKNINHPLYFTLNDSVDLIKVSSKNIKRFIAEDNILSYQNKSDFNIRSPNSYVENSK